jgi:hypothetical protein
MSECTERNYVTPEQIARARQVGTLEYIQRHEPDELTKVYIANGRTMHCRAGEYRTKTHDSLAIHGTWFYWWSRGFGGKSALDYLVKVKGQPFQDAVRALTEDSPVQIPPPVSMPTPQAPEQKELRLPPESRDTSRVFAYLAKSRGIDREIITHCLQHRLLYEDAEHHNAVFIGYEGRRPRFGSMRSTISDSKWRMCRWIVQRKNARPKALPMWCASTSDWTPPITACCASVEVHGPAATQVCRHFHSRFLVLIQIGSGGGLAVFCAARRSASAGGQ